MDIIIIGLFYGLLFGILLVGLYFDRQILKEAKSNAPRFEYIYGGEPALTSTTTITSTTTMPLEEKIKEKRPEHKVFPHTLLVGQAGLGKTTLAQIIKEEAQKIYGHGISFHGLTPSQLNAQSDLDKLMTEIEEYDFVFIDEIHRLKKPISESLFQAIEGGYYHLTREKKIELGDNLYLGQSEQTFQTIELPKFTCVGGTTEGGDLLKPLIMRFHKIELGNYSVTELEQIIENFLRKENPKTLKDYIGQETAKNEIIMELNALELCKYNGISSEPESSGFAITPNAKQAIAVRSFGTPRIAIKYTKKCRSFAIAEDMRTIDLDVVRGYMAMKNVDKNGLTPKHRTALKVLLTNYPKEVSTNSLIEELNVSRGEIENIYFPDLTFKGYARRSSRSWRMATEKALDEYGYLLENEDEKANN